MMEAEIVTLVSNVGFPIAITFYLIFKFEKVIKGNTEAINSVTIAIQSCKRK